MSADTEKEYFYGRSTDEQHERAYWRRIGAEILGVILLALVLAAALHAGKVYADQLKTLGTVENPQGTRITLVDAPCDSPQVMALISANVPEEYWAGWRKVDAVFAMKPDFHIQSFQGCFYEMDGMVLLVFEDGDHFQIPRAAFKRIGVDA